MFKGSKKTILALGLILGVAGTFAYTAGAYSWQNIVGAKFGDGVNPLDASYMTGKVGIGTTTPVSPLHVFSDLSAQPTVIFQHTAVSPSLALLDADDGIRFVYNSNNSRLRIQSADSLGINAGNTIASFERNTGRVGIGTDAPVANLDVAGSIFLGCVACGSTTDINGTQAWGDMVIQGRVLSSSDDIHLSPPGGGNVNINSNYRAAGGSSSGVAGLVVEGNVTAAGFLYASDLNLKENIKDLENDFDILNISPKRFSWKDNYGQENANGDIGVIAQDVEKYFPEFVTISQEGHRTVNYPKLAVPLISVVKQQQQQIDELKKELEQIKKSIK